MGIDSMATDHRMVFHEVVFGENTETDEKLRAQLAASKTCIHTPDLSDGGDSGSTRTQYLQKVYLPNMNLDNKKMIYVKSQSDETKIDTFVIYKEVTLQNVFDEMRYSSDVTIEAHLEYLKDLKEKNKNKKLEDLNAGGKEVDLEYETTRFDEQCANKTINFDEQCACETTRFDKQCAYGKEIFYQIFEKVLNEEGVNKIERDTKCIYVNLVCSKQSEPGESKKTIGAGVLLKYLELFNSDKFMFLDCVDASQWEQYKKSKPEEKTLIGNLLKYYTDKQNFIDLKMWRKTTNFMNPPLQNMINVVQVLNPKMNSETIKVSAPLVAERLGLSPFFSLLTNRKSTNLLYKSPTYSFYHCS